MSLLPVTVIITTYDTGDGARFSLLYQTIEGLVKNLQYPELRWIITDDGSPNHAEMVEKVKQLIPAEVIFFNTERKGVGYAKNNALRKAFETSNIVYLTEDDWRLDQPIDLLPYVQLMLDHEDVAMVRFGFLGGEMTAQYIGYGVGLDYWSLQRDSGLYVYSGQNSLRSSKMYSVVGWHREDLDAGNEELDYCHKWNKTVHDLKILWPARYGCSLGNGPFTNTGLTTSLNTVKPHES